MTLPIRVVVASCQQRDSVSTPYVDVLLCGHEVPWVGTRYRRRRCVECGRAGVEGQEALFDHDEPVVREPVARRTDPDTSWSAARSVRNQSDTHNRIVRLFRQYGPMSDQMLLMRWRQHAPPHVDSYPLVSESGLRSRRAELVDLGTLEWSGEKERTVSGRATRIWRLS